MVERNRKIDMRGLTLQVAAVEIAGDTGIAAVAGDIDASGTITVAEDVVVTDDVTAGGDVAAVGDVSGASLTVPGLDYIFAQVQYKATVTIVNTATAGKEAAIAIPANFRPQMVAVEVTVASTNASNLVDIGDDADTDSFVDGLAISVATTGYKGTFACNGVRGYPGGTSGSGTELVTPDEVEVIISADPGASGVTMELTFYGHTITAA